MQRQTLTKSLTAVLAALALAGCGSGPHPSTSAAKPLDELGVASAQSFIHVYDKAKLKSPVILASDFRDWVSGKLANSSIPGSPPGSPLSPAERHAAAITVLAYARQLVARGAFPATLPSGQTVITYLEEHGVKP